MDYAYKGYLAPHLPKILQMAQKGKRTSDIARAMMLKDPELKNKDWNTLRSAITMIRNRYGYASMPTHRTDEVA